MPRAGITEAEKPGDRIAEADMHAGSVIEERPIAVAGRLEGYEAEKKPFGETS